MLYLPPSWPCVVCKITAPTWLSITALSRNTVGPLLVTPPADGPIPGRYCGSFRLYRSAIGSTWFLLTSRSGRQRIPFLAVSDQYCGYFQPDWSAIGLIWLFADPTVGTIYHTLSARCRLPPRCRADTRSTSLAVGPTATRYGPSPAPDINLTIGWITGGQDSTRVGLPNSPASR
jgi:hypothetical protein